MRQVSLNRCSQNGGAESSGWSGEMTANRQNSIDRITATWKNGAIIEVTVSGMAKIVDELLLSTIDTPEAIMILRSRWRRPISEMETWVVEDYGLGLSPTFCNVLSLVEGSGQE